MEEGIEDVHLMHMPRAGHRKLKGHVADRACAPALQPPGRRLETCHDPSERVGIRRGGSPSRRDHIVEARKLRPETLEVESSSTGRPRHTVDQERAVVGGGRGEALEKAMGVGSLPTGGAEDAVVAD